MSKYDIRVGDKVILKDACWVGVDRNAKLNSIYKVVPVDDNSGNFFTAAEQVQIDIFTDFGHCEDFELYQTNTKVTDVEIGDIVEVVVLDSLQLNAYPEMTKLLGKRGVVRDKRAYLDVKFDDEVDEAIWAIHYHCVRVVEKRKQSNDLSKLNVNLTVDIDDKKVAEQVNKYINEYVTAQPKPIQSDGGSSSYYDLPIPEELLNKILERKEEGKAYIKTEEIIRYYFGNDFDKGNLFKSLVRIHSAELGFGKAGNSIEYDCNKIHYSADKIAQRNK